MPNVKARAQGWNLNKTAQMDPRYIYFNNFMFQVLFLCEEKGDINNKMEL